MWTHFDVFILKFLKWILHFGKYIGKTKIKMTTIGICIEIYVIWNIIIEILHYEMYLCCICYQRPFKIQYLVKLFKNYFRNADLHPDIEKYNPDVFLKREKEEKLQSFLFIWLNKSIYVHLYIWQYRTTFYRIQFLASFMPEEHQTAADALKSITWNSTDNISPTLFHQYSLLPLKM